MHLSDLTKTFFLANDAIMRRRTRRVEPTDVDPLDFYPSCAVPGRSPCDRLYPSRRGRRRYRCATLLLVLLFFGATSTVFLAAKCRLVLTRLSDLCRDENVVVQRPPEVDPSTACPDFEREIAELRREIDALKGAIARDAGEKAAPKKNESENEEMLMRTCMEAQISRALLTYDSDKIGLFDHAAQYAGGTVVSTPDTVPYPVNQTVEILGLFTVKMWSRPDNLLQPNALPGECFIFHGSEGKVVIRLGSAVRVSAVTMEHVPRMLVEDQSCAPKDFAVAGLRDEDEDGDPLGRFTYEIAGDRPVQTFDVAAGQESGAYPYVMLHVMNNHGNREYTCVYRFRVHSTDK